jgi:glycosyltransferase involved in cell wall biosynthesis
VPRVSVVTPCFNAERYLTQTVQSVCRQTLADWQLVVVDDASTDGSSSIADRLAASDRRVSAVHLEHNAGVAAARRIGAELATGEYLLFLDADDVLEPTMLEQTVSELDRRPGLAAVYTGHGYIGPDGEDLGPERGHWPWARCVATRFWVRRLPDTEPATPFESIFGVAAMLPSLTVMRRSAYQATPGWDVSLGQGCEDTDLFLQLALRGPVHHLPERLVRYRRHPDQASQRHDLAGQYQKLFAKWLSRGDLDPAQQQLVRDAEWFRTGRLVPSLNLQSALEHVRSGDLPRAARLLATAVSAYSPRRPPPTLYGRGTSADAAAAGLGPISSSTR